MIPPLETLVRKDRPERLLAVDPGHTTGWALFVEGKLTECGSLPTLSDPLALKGLLQNTKPTYVVYEVYQIYNWRLTQHSFSDVPTLRIIGALEFICAESDIRSSSQTAQVAKNFCTDDKLLAWGLTSTNKHARDAIRHGTYFLIFGLPTYRRSNRPSKTVG